MKEFFYKILENFNVEYVSTNVRLYGKGLIHKTWLVTTPSGKFILQQINTGIFNPQDIEFNLSKIIRFFEEFYPGYKTIEPLYGLQGMILSIPEGSFRMFNYLENSYTMEMVTSPQIAWEASVNFAGFVHKLIPLDAETIRPAIPHFHDLIFRHKQYVNALNTGDLQRIKEGEMAIKWISRYQHILNKYDDIVKKNLFAKRIMHHDTKISNILFDKGGKGICVIDLDTVMPGYFISDLGDMIRSYVSPVNEEENNLDKIQVRQDFLEAIKEGYLSAMGNSLSAIEKDHFLYSGQCMIYMQALRFLTDHFNKDIYYGANYEGHNLNRTLNQLTLLDRLTEIAHSS